MRIIPDEGRFDMNDAIAMAQRLERRERERYGTRASARRSLAGKLRVARGTLENLVRGRTKKIDAGMRDRLRSLIVKELETEVARLTHELEIYRQCGSPNYSPEVSEVETYLAQSRAILSRIGLGKGNRDGTGSGAAGMDARGKDSNRMATGNRNTPG